MYGRLNDGPKGVHVLIPRAWDEVSSHWADGARSWTHRWDTEGGGSSSSRGWIMEAGPQAGGCAHLRKLEGARSSFSPGAPRWTGQCVSDSSHGGPMSCVALSKPLCLSETLVLAHELGWGSRGRRGGSVSQEPGGVSHTGSHQHVWLPLFLPSLPVTSPCSFSLCPRETPGVGGRKEPQPVVL